LKSDKKYVVTAAVKFKTAIVKASAKTLNINYNCIPALTNRATGSEDETVLPLSVSGYFGRLNFCIRKRLIPIKESAFLKITVF